jgi:hypothetical protein
MKPQFGIAIVLLLIFAVAASSASAVVVSFDQLVSSTSHTIVYADLAASSSDGAFCGDGYCDAGEDGWCSDCSDDPDPYCGDGVCDAGESSSNCAKDCPVCVPDEKCSKLGCGNFDSCGKYCGDCPTPTPKCGDNVCNGDETAAT